MQLIVKTRDRGVPGRLADGLLELRLTGVVGLEECFEFDQPLMQRFLGGISVTSLVSLAPLGVTMSGSVTFVEDGARQRVFLCRAFRCGRSQSYSRSL